MPAAKVLVNPGKPFLKSMTSYLEIALTPQESAR